MYVLNIFKINVVFLIKLKKKKIWGEYLTIIVNKSPLKYTLQKYRLVILTTVLN